MDITEKPTSLQKAAQITGISYSYLRLAVKSSCPPPTYIRPGCKRPQVIPAEVMDWYRKIGAQQ